MRKHFLKSAVCLSLSAVLLFGEAGAVWGETDSVSGGAETVEETMTAAEAPAVTEPSAEKIQEKENEGGAGASEDIDAVGEKIVQPYTLADVTGLTYDPARRRLFWNKVLNASYYRYTVLDAAGETVSSGRTAGLYVNFSGSYFAEGAAYVFQVTAVNGRELYQVAEGAEYDRTNAAGTVFYKYPVSANPAQISSIGKISTANAVSVLSGIAVKEVANASVTFTVAPSVIQIGEEVYYEYSNNAEFKDNEGQGLFCRGRSADVVNGAVGSITVGFDSFVSGDTLYIRARVYNSNYNNGTGDDESRYSPYVSGSYKIPAPVMGDIGVVVTENSVCLRPDVFGSAVTGFQYQRKNGKKWTDLGCQSDDYTDKGLNSDTKYSYRVRGYIYNKKTRKTSYTGWKNADAYTWGAALNVHASAAGAAAVKLTWNKVPKAEGYEIYRVETESGASNRIKGESEEAFQNAVLIKTIKKAKKKPSYKDKKLTKGRAYTYIVRAFRTMKKTKCYIQDQDFVTLASDTSSINKVSSYYTANGGVTVTWKKMTGIAGYRVEKKNRLTGQYVTYKRLKKGAVSVTLPKAAAGGNADEYKIVPYKGNKTFGSITEAVYPKLPAVKNVKAVKTADGIRVSWSAVTGADYYRVYRCRTNAPVYDKTTKLYSSYGSGAEPVAEAEYTDTSTGVSLAPAGGDSVSGFYYSSELSAALNGDKFYDPAVSYEIKEIKGTSVVDKKITVTGLIEKPEAGQNTEPGWYGRYEKNPDGSLRTQQVTMIEGPQAGEEYFYFVQAVAKPASGAEGNSSYYDDDEYEQTGSTVSAGYTKAAHIVYTNVKAPKAAKAPSVKSKKKASVTVKIKKAKGANGYAVYRSTKKGRGYVKIGTTNKTSYVDNNVVGGKTYYYKIAPYKKSENGTFVYYKQSKAKKVRAKK